MYLDYYSLPVDIGSLAVFATALYTYRRTRIRVPIELDTTSRNGNIVAILGMTDTPRVFHYLNIPTVKDLYTQLDEAGSVPSSKDLEQTAAGDFSAGIGAPLTFVRGRNRRTAKIRATFKPESDANRMYIAIERRLLNDQHLTLIDLVSGFDTAPLAPFDDWASQLEEDHEFKVSPDIINSIRMDWTRFQEQKGVTQLTQIANHYVAIRAVYTLNYKEPSDCYKLTASVGRYREASITASCPAETFNASSKTAITVGSKFQATCVAKALAWDEFNAELILLPVAIFLAACSPAIPTLAIISVVASTYQLAQNLAPQADPGRAVLVTTSPAAANDCAAADRARAYASSPTVSRLIDSTSLSPEPSGLLNWMRATSAGPGLLRPPCGRAQ